MVTTRPKGSSAQWLSRASPPTQSQLFACNVASGSNFGTGRELESSVMSTPVQPLTLGYAIFFFADHSRFGGTPSRLARRS